MNIAAFSPDQLGRIMLVGYEHYHGDAHDWTVKQALPDYLEERLSPKQRYRTLWQIFRSKQFDTLMLQYPAQTMAWFAAVLCWMFRKQLVCDVFVPLYEMRVTDRGARRHSWFAYRAALLDWLACRLADQILVDTREHGRYLAKFTHTSPEKYRILYLQVQPDLFTLPDVPPSNDDFTVLFVGRFIPLQGIEYILQAQKILEDDGLPVSLRLVGSGQTRAAMKKLAQKLKLQQIVFRDHCSPADVANEISQAKLCLGIFGSSPKTQRVIPHKVLEALAGSRPVITARTPAMLERFPAETELLHYCPVADAPALAAKIRDLYSQLKSQ